MSPQPRCRLRIVVADRAILFRRGLTAVIRQHLADCDVAEVADLPAAAVLQARWEADLLVTSADSLGGDSEGADLRRQLQALHAEFPRLRLAVLSSQADLGTAMDWLSAGACGCISSAVTPEELGEALRVIGSGHGYISSAILEQPIRSRMMVSGMAIADEDFASDLTARQQEVLRLVAEGRPTKDIARRLGLSVSTVKAHLSAAYRSLGAHNRVEAVVRARAAADPAAAA